MGGTGRKSGGEATQDVGGGAGGGTRRRREKGARGQISAPRTFAGAEALDSGEALRAGVASVSGYTGDVRNQKVLFVLRKVGLKPLVPREGLAPLELRSGFEGGSLLFPPLGITVWTMDFGSLRVSPEALFPRTVDETLLHKKKLGSQRPRTGDWAELLLPNQNYGGWGTGASEDRTRGRTKVSWASSPVHGPRRS